MSNFSKIFQLFSKGFCKSLIFYFSFYLIFSPLFSFQVFAQTLPINPIPNNATLGTFSNNIPVLNITKPTTSGVSVNKFNNFNVGKEGLIVNNLNLQNYNITYKSALSNQHIEFNRNFRDGEAAKVILNEVVSGNATSLLGTTEIYGRKADYIVANPNGITCAGCGFINTSRLSLITGSSNIKNGDIESFTISPNAVLQIEGQDVGNLGLYSASSAEIVSNVIKISGEIQTPEDLRIFQGDESFDWKNFSITSSEKIGSNIAVDVSALGGMKANNIYVVATGKGFGVNLGSDVVANGNIEITSAGEIKVKNAIANDNVVMKTHDKITADNGNIVANNVLIDADNLENKSNIVATDNIYIDVKNDIENIGKIRADSFLFLSADDIHNYGQILSNKDMEVMVTNNLINYRASGILAGGNIWMKIANDLINYKADIYAGGDLSVEGRDDIENNFVAVNPDTIYDNPYVEKEKDLGNVSGGNLSFAMDDDEEEALIFILKNGDKIQLPIDAFPDDAIAGAKYEYNGYTFILGTETVTEKEILNPEYEKCENDCEDIPKTVIKKIYSYSGTDDFTIKDSSGENIFYTFGEEDFNDEIDDLGVLNNTSVVQSNALNEYKNTFLDYDFNNNFFNNFVNLAGRIEAGGNIEINANNIVNKSFDINTGANGVSLYYDKIRDKVDGWRTAWKELGRYRISGVNLDGIAGAIVSGKNLILNSENILNQSSILSSKQNIILNASKLSNITISDVVVLPIFMQRVSRKHGKKRRKNRTEYQTQRYYSKQRATILAGGSLSIKSDVLKNDQDVNPTSGIVASVDNPNIVDGKISVEVNLPVGDNGLFKIADDGKYLVETNVPFIKSKDYVGSDYFFDGKGALFNGVDTNKIIGDPAYETKIIMDAIVRSTQQHYLANDGSIGSDADQMKRLYDNALEVREELGLKVGIALNKSQITNLKKDIIWYITKEVNGEKVLVPELYLSQATLDSIDDNRGSKITGFNVGIESDYVSNYGNITSNNILSVKSNSLVNESNDNQVATMKSKRLTTIDSKNIANLSGNIEGQITQIKANNLVNQTKVLSSDYDDKYELKKHTEITGNIATISGEKELSIEANNALVNSGAKIESKDGDVNIKAGTATFNTIQLHNRTETKKTSDNLVSQKNKISIKDTIENKESEINAGGNFNLSTSNDANFAGANVNVGNDALLDIGGNTNIIAVKDREYNYNKTSKSILGGVYSKKDTIIDENEILKNSNITVKNGLNIVSNKDVNVVASNIDIGGNANILAGYKLTESGVEKTRNKANVNIINDIETSSHYKKHEKINGLDFDNFDISASNGKISANIDISSANENELKENINNVVSSDINIGGNLNIASTNDINIKASNIDASVNSYLNADNDINIINDFNTSKSENIEKDITKSVGGNVGNGYVDVAYATKALIDAEQSVKKAKKELKKSKEARDRGEASNEAVKDAELNLSLAIINFTNAEIALASSIAGAASAAASSYGTGFYISGSLTDDIDKYTENSTFSQAVGSNLTAENISLKSDNNMTHIGSNIIANDTISYDITNKLKVFAGENTYRSESYNEHITAGASYGNNAVQGNVGYDKSRNVSSGTSFTNSNINAKNIQIKTGSDAKFDGANVSATENLIASVGGDLQLVSKQDSDYAKGKSFGMSLSGGAGVRKEAVGKGSVGIGFNTGKSNHDSSWVNDMTELTAKNVDINVAGKTSLTGAMIDGSESLHLATNELEFKDLHDFERSTETGYGVNTGVGISTNKEKTNLHPNGETSLALNDKGYNKEQITHATIGEGVIEVAQGSDLTGLNRDTTKAQEITKDMTTGALDTTANIDNRVFTSDGRADIAKDHKKAGSFIENVSSNLYNAMAKDTKFTDAMKSIKFEEASKLAVERLLSQDGGKEALEIISGQKQVSPEEKDLALSKFAGEFADITGVDIGDVKTMLSTEPIGGSFDKDGKDIYLNDNYVSGDVESGLGVFGHEIGHSMYGDNEATAGYLGSRFADAYTDGLWINGENYSLGNWNIVDGNSLYVGQNGSDFANVKNRDDFILETLIIGSYYVGVNYFAGDGDIIEGNKRMKNTDTYKYTFGVVNDISGYIIGKSIEGTDYLLNKTGITDSEYYLSERIGKGLKWYEENVPENIRDSIGYVGDVSNVALTGTTVAKVIDKTVSKTISTTKGVGNKINQSIDKDVNGITIDFGDTLPKETLLNLELKSGQKLHVTNHLTERMIERNVSFDDITDALKNPLGISKVKMDKFGPSYKIVGKNATVIINPETNTLITTYKTTSNTKRLKQILDKL